MKKLQFKVKLGNTSVPGLVPPFDVVKVFGTKARIPVRGTINGLPFRSSLMPMGGCHAMAINREICEGAAVKASDTIEVVMERDDAERTLEIPPLLKKELAKSKAVATNWEKYSYTHRKERARSIVEVKQEETRARRLAKVMDVLKKREEMAGLTSAQRPDHLADIVLLKQPNRGDPSCACCHTRRGVLHCHTSQR